MKKLTNILKDDAQNQTSRPVSSKKNVRVARAKNTSTGRAGLKDGCEISLIGPELRTIPQEEVFLLLSILPPSIVALIEQAHVPALRR